MRNLFLLLMMLATATSWSQSNPTIRTGRPGQSIGPNVVGANYFQIQSGIEESSLRGDMKSNTSLLNNVLRYGLSESFEISSVIDLQKDTFPSSSAADKSGVSGLQLGFRYNLIAKPDGLTPALGIQTRFKLSQVDHDYAPEHAAPIIVLASSHKLTSDISWGHNLGVTYDGTSTVPKYIFISNLSYSLIDKWGSFIEIYGDSQNAVGSFFVDAGLSYLHTKDLQYDFSFGGGENHGISESFASLGVSWRFKTI